ncbi:MAG: efflux RND transporter periplasmic adaptor subunit [Nitrospiraceae bacterium]|nr:efflux RND transporter periplasmic adaptor subunit [Nitrospiraceae bacterium]
MIALFLPLALILGVMPACSGKPRQAQPNPVVPVIAGSSIQKTIPVLLNAIGNVEAYSTVSVKSLAGGQLMKVYFREGQFVKKGSLLFRIDPRPFQAALRQAEANLARDMAVAKNAREDANRYAFLVQKDYVAKEQYDQLAANAASSEAVVQADKALVENSRLQLAYCTIQSPIDGKTGSLQVHEGNIVKANDVTLLTIQQITPVNVTFAIPEQLLAEVQKYMAKGKKLRVKAFVNGDTEHPEEGVLTFVDNKVDTATGTIMLKGTFANRDMRLWPGQYDNITLELTTMPNATLVPSQAVQASQKGSYIYVIKPDMTVQYREVSTGPSYEGYTVITNGVAPGESVVTDGQMRLMPGAKVQMRQSLDGAAK